MELFCLLFVICLSFSNFNQVFGAAPVFVNPSGNPTTSIAEDTGLAQSIYSLSATDADGDALTFTVSTGSSYFTVTGTSLVTATTYDYENQKSYSIVISVSDGSNTVTSSMTVDITDVNDNAPSFPQSVYTNSLAEGTAGSTNIRTLACSDNDDSSTNNVCTLSIQSGDDAGTPKFSISGSTLQTSSNAIDYESLSGQNYIYTLVIIGEDNGTPTLTGTTTVFVQITGTNDNTPSISGTTPASVSVAETVAVGTTVCTVNAADADHGSDGVLAFSIIAGNADGMFQMNTATGEIYTVQTLDYETTPSYTLTIKALDGGSLSATTDVTITVTDVNDNTPTCSSEIKSVSETASNPTTVTTLTCSDADSSPSLTYSITNGNSASCFALSGTTLSTNCVLDYDSGDQSYTLTIQVSDGTYSSSSTIVVNLDPVNDDTPSFSSSPTYSFDEDTAVGTSLATYAATDGDLSPHAIESYAITSVTNSGSSLFSIDKTTGEIKLSQALDYETQTSFEITVTATDGGSSIGTGTVTISVLNVNDNTPQCSPQNHVISVDENSAVGYQVIADLGCSDDDGDSLTYSFTSNPSSAFAIDTSGSTPALDVSVSPDFESATSYAVVINVVDNGSPSLSTSINVQISINNLNEITPTISGTTPASVSVAENSAVGTTVCTVNAADTDAGSFGDIAFSIIAGNTDVKFDIDPATGKIFTVQTLDYETTPSYTLTIKALDGGSLSVTTDVTITVTDVNDNTPTCSSEIKSVSETASNPTTVTTLTCSDADSSPSLTYSITNGNSASCFALSGTTLSTNCALDYDSGDQSYTLTIQVSDGTYSSSSTIVVNLDPVNEDPPSFSSSPTYSFDEDTAVGTSLATYAATDGDLFPHAIESYAITSVTNSGSGLFSIDVTTGEIKLAQDLDYETQTSYEITVTATDGGSSVGTGTVTISVLDINDNAPTCSPQNHVINVDENSAVGYQVIADLGCSNIDGNILAYSFISNPSSAFAIDTSGSTPALDVSVSPDFESTTAYTVVINVVDNGTPSLSTSINVQININNLNENTPTISGTTPASVSVAENSAVGTTVCTVNAADTDAGSFGDIAFSIIAGNADAKFDIDPATGEIFTVQTLDYETTPSYTLTIKALDGGSLSATTDVTITVTDVNDNTPTCSSEIKSVSETASNPTTVTTLTCTDADSSPSLSYSITNGNSDSCFALSGTSLNTNCDLDYDSGVQSYTLTIEVTDGTYSSSSTIVVNLDAVNEATPSFGSSISLNFDEDTTVGTALTTYAATDADVSPHTIVAYAIASVTNSGSSLFSIDTNTGEITLARALDFESQTVYEITVTATDGGSSTGSGTVTINVQNTNDNSPVCSPQSHVIDMDENSAVGYVVISDLGCSDADGDTLTYTFFTNPSSAFSIDTSGATPALDVSVSPDFESQTSYSVVIKVEDSGTPTLSSTISAVVNINNLNEHTPTISGTTPASISLAEDTAVGNSVFTLNAADSDGGNFGSLEYSIIGGNSEGKFQIDAVSGEAKLSAALDYETTPSYSLTLHVADGGSPALTATSVVSITVTNVNEFTPSCPSTSYVYNVDETTASGTTITTFACSDGDGDSVTYSITSGNSDGCFSLGSSSGVLETACALDYDTGVQDYTLTIEVDDGTKTEAINVQINLNAINEDTPSFSSSLTVSYAEDLSPGSTITTHAATDGDASPHDIVSYAIQSVTNGGGSLFSVDSDTGLIKLTSPLDYESQQNYEIEVIATDGGGNVGTSTVTVSVTNVNDNTPTCTPQAQVLSVDENTATSTSVTTLVCSDADTGDTLSYTLTQNPSSMFGLDTSVSPVELIISVSPDYESTTSYSLQVTVQDNGSPVKSTTVEIDVNINNVNEASPVFVSAPYAVTVNENEAVGSTIITITATDTDAGDVISYSFDAVYTLFTLDSSSGNILLIQSLDFETASSHTLVVKAYDGTAYTTSSVVVTVGDINEVPSFVSSTYTPNFDENQASGSTLVQVSAIDNDSGADGTVSYTITSGDGMSYFSIDSSTGIITSSAVIDYEANSFFYLIVQAADGGSPSLSTQCLVEVTVNDLNDNAPVFVPATYTVSISEDSVLGYTVTTVTATDADSVSNNNNVFEYSIITASVPFTIGSTTGIITTNSLLNRETTASYTIVIHGTDKGATANTGTSTLTVSLIDVNDNTPTISGTYDTTLAEDTSVNTVVFTIAGSDLDYQENAQLSYSFNSGNTDSDFSIEVGTGIIQIAKALDRETTPSYTLEVYVIDGGTSARTGSVTCTVTINDVNDNTPIWTGDPFTLSVAENVATSTSVGTIGATDADTGTNSALTYSILGYWSGGSVPFSIDGSTGVITTTAALDRETVDLYIIWCRVQDAGSPILSSDTNVTININDINDNNPIFASASYSDNTIENAAVATDILTVVATDADTGVNAELTYSIDTSTTAGVRADTYLSVNSSSGVISVKSNIDRESDPTFTFVVLATDGGTPSRSASTSVTITVQDVNDNNPIFSRTFYNAETPDYDTCSSTIAVVTATDLDAGVNAEIYYYLVTTSDHFALDSTSGAITQYTGLTDGTIYTLYANARDNGSPELITGTSATIRIDPYRPDDKVISFYLYLNQTYYESVEAAFLSQLSAVYQVTYPTASAKRWCLSDVGGYLIVHIYVVQDNTTDSIGALSSAKNFLSADTAHDFVALDENGTPSSKITGATWDPYAIWKVLKYATTTTEDTPWIETATGIAIVTVCCVVGLASIITITVLVVRYIRGRRSVAERNGLTRAEISEEIPSTEARQNNANNNKNNTKKPEKARKESMEKGGFLERRSPPPYRSPTPGKNFMIPPPMMPSGKKPTPTSGYFSGEALRSNKDPVVNNRQFDGRVYDEKTGSVVEYSTKTSEKQVLTDGSGNPVRVDLGLDQRESEF